MKSHNLGVYYTPMGLKERLGFVTPEVEYSEEEAAAEVTKFASDWETIEEGDYSAAGRIDKKRGFTSSDTFTVIKGVSSLADQLVTTVSFNGKHFISHITMPNVPGGDDHILIHFIDPKTKSPRGIEYKNHRFKIED